MDVCVVLYRCTANRVQPGLRDRDTLLTVDNTHDNQGFAAGANTAAAKGSDPLVCFVNPDGDLTADCIERLERTMDDPSVVACTPRLGAATTEPDENGDLVWLLGTCLVVRRSAFEKVGGFDERLFMYEEDIDLSYKLAPLGRLVLASDAEFDHDWGPRSFKARHREYRNFLVVKQRHRPPADWRRMLRDGVYALRTGNLRVGFGRLTGTADYLLRGRGWV